MKILIDSIDLKKLKKLIKYLPIAGVTSNPSIVKQVAPEDFFSYMKEVKKLIGDGELHVQVISNDYKGMISEAEKIVKELGDETYIKVPATLEGIRAIKILKNEGYNVTATAIYTLAQAYVALEAGADTIAPYTNRIENLGGNPYDLAFHLSNEIDKSNSNCRILAASFKNIDQVINMINSGSQSVTVSPDLLEQIFENPNIKKAVDDFTQDWESVYSKKVL